MPSTSRRRQAGLLISTLVFVGLLFYALAIDCCGDSDQWPVLVGIGASALAIFFFVDRKRT